MIVNATIKKEGNNRFKLYDDADAFKRLRRSAFTEESISQLVLYDAYRSRNNPNEFKGLFGVVVDGG